jgi:leucine dehydrogenase
MDTTLEDTLSLEELEVPGYERVIKVTDEPAELKAIICIHNRRLCKAALGGTRICPYPTFDEALVDAMRLARGMTYKSAVSESGWGGGKSVIIFDPQKKKPEKMLLAFAEAVNRLEGLYICAEDAGCTLEDINVIARKTPFVVGVPHQLSSGNPAPFTANGVFRGIQASCKKCFGTDSVDGLTIAIQGVGSVGMRLAEILFWQGAKLILSDLDQEKVERTARLYGAKVISPSSIFEQECDLFVPCAMGGILNSQTIPKLRCSIVAGAANNQLLTDEDGERLMQRNILYAPDFVINAGGLMNVTEETREGGYHPARARDKIHKIYDQLMMIFEISTQNQISTSHAAEKLADYRLQYQVGRRLEPIYLHHSNVSY